MTKNSSPVLDALFALEDHIRRLPPERRAIAIALAVSRLRRLHPQPRRAQDEASSPAQLDLERELLASEKKP